MGRLQDIYKKRMVDYLAKEGERISNDALFSKQTQNDTMNQADAYGYAVFYDGTLKKKGYAALEMSGQEHRGWEKMGIPAGTGREWLNEFFTEWKPTNKGFVLVVVNAAFYSLIQEQGGGTLTKEYRIISQITGDMKDLQEKFKGATLNGININV